MRVRGNNDYLFMRAQLADALRAQSDTIARRVQGVAESVIRAADEATLMRELTQELRIAPLELDLSRKTMRREETQVDVTDDPNRFGFPDGRRIIVPGIRVTVSTPYSGEPELWHLRPSTYRTSFPRGSIRSGPSGTGGVLDLVVEQPADKPIENIKTEVDRAFDDIAFYIENQRRDLSSFDATLQRQIETELAARRGRLTKHDGLAELLGIPEATAVAPNQRPPPTASPVRSVTTGAAPGRGWDAFISHASEDKDSFVRPLVSALTSAGLRIWFDEHELRVGDSLRRTIDRGLAQSRYGIVVLSPHFFAKQWPQRELDGLVAREDTGEKVVLPVWHNITVSQVRGYSPTLADRLAVMSAEGVDTVARELLRVLKPA